MAIYRCKNCGSEPVIVCKGFAKTCDMEMFVQEWVIYCDSCTNDRFVYTNSVHHLGSKEDAINKWNSEQIKPKEFLKCIMKDS